MKILNVVFWTSVAGIGLCLILTIYTGVHESRARKVAEPEPTSIVVPAVPAGQ